MGNFCGRFSWTMVTVSWFVHTQGLIVTVPLTGRFQHCYTYPYTIKHPVPKTCLQAHKAIFDHSLREHSPINLYGIQSLELEFLLSSVTYKEDHLFQIP